MTSSNSNSSASRTSLFRPCIDIHSGLVKQIVGSSLKDSASEELLTNFVATHPPSYYSNLYQNANLSGAHVIKLGGGEKNDEAAKQALKEWKNGLQVGGGMNEDNANSWLDHGAEKIIVTSYLFPECKFSLERLEGLTKSIGKERLVIDVSCRKKDGKWIVAMNRWQDLTDMEVNKESLTLLSKYCSEFLIHAADVEGLCKGIDEELVEKLGEWCEIPTTYAGGARHLGDLELVNKLSNGKVDLTFGSALDIFGGNGVTLDELIQWNRKAGQSPS